MRRAIALAVGSQLCINLSTKRYIKQAVDLKECQTYQTSHAGQECQVLGHKFQAIWSDQGLKTCIKVDINKEAYISVSSHACRCSHIVVTVPNQRFFH